MPVNATKRLNANESTAYALLGESGDIQYVFEDKALAEHMAEKWRDAPAPMYVSIESVNLVHSSLEDLSNDD